MITVESQQDSQFLRSQSRTPIALVEISNAENSAGFASDHPGHFAYRAFYFAGKNQTEPLIRELDLAILIAGFDNDFQNCVRKKDGGVEG